MLTLADELQDIINDCSIEFDNFSEEELLHRSAPDKWSRKEIIGHLVDSAQNNIQRFVRGRYEEGVSISYNQNEWVAASDYQHYHTAELFHLWMLLNQHLCILWRNTPESSYSHAVVMGGETWTLRNVAVDYIDHLNHHLKQLS
jgi:hypothetical protein